MRICRRDQDCDRPGRQAGMGVPELRQPRSEQDERGETYLRLYWNTVLESGQNTGDQGTVLHFIKQGTVVCTGLCSHSLSFPVEEKDMNYSAIKYCDIANGTGVRTVLSLCRAAEITAKTVFSRRRGL